MTPEDVAQQITEAAVQAFAPPMRITSEYAGALLTLIVEQGTLAMKARALEISTRYMGRMGEWS